MKEINIWDSETRRSHLLPVAEKTLLSQLESCVAINSGPRIRIPPLAEPTKQYVYRVLICLMNPIPRRTERHIFDTSEILSKSLVISQRIVVYGGVVFGHGLGVWPTADHVSDTAPATRRSVR